MSQLLTAVERLAAASTPILLTGETGAGKDWVARLVHRRSRRSGPLVALSCEGLPAERRRVLTEAKQELRKVFHRET